MKWNLSLIKSKHTIGPDIGYYDPESNIIVPLLKTITPKILMQMEEFSQAEQGQIFMDISTGFCGVLVVDYERTT